jgi:hypothetical protein
MIAKEEGNGGGGNADETSNYFSSINTNSNSNANRGRTYFPSDDSARSGLSINPSQQQHETKTVVPMSLYPTDNIQTRLPVYATTHDATTASTNKFNFPKEGSRAHTQHPQPQPSSAITFNSAASSQQQPSSNAQQSRVSFPGSRTKRQAPAANVDGRILSSTRYKSEVRVFKI